MLSSGYVSIHSLSLLFPSPSPSPPLLSLILKRKGAAAQRTPIWYWTEDEWMYEFAVDLVGTPSPPLVVSMSWGWPEPEQVDYKNPKIGFYKKNNKKKSKRGVKRD